LEFGRIGGIIGAEAGEGHVMNLSRRTWPWLIVSFAVAAISCFGPRVYPYDPMLQVSLWMSGLWGAIVLAGIVYEGRQGLWLLVSAPLALFAPVLMILWERACRLNTNACP
jgi:hypothetical protein